LPHRCFVRKEYVISAPDIDCIYDVPIHFESDNLGRNLLKELGLRAKKTDLLENWEKKCEKRRRSKKEVNIGIVGKYIKSGKFDLKDSYVSVLEAMTSALDRTKISKILDGYRGKTQLPKNKLIDMLEKIQRMLISYPQIVSLDINPVMITQEKAIAVDVKVYLKS